MNIQWTVYIKPMKVITIRFGNREHRSTASVVR